MFLLFGLTIFVHEFGHFIAAIKLGLVVETFSIGFGPAIWKKKHKGVLYKIGCIPFGGYVALPQLDPGAMEGIQGKNKKDEKSDPEKKDEDSDAEKKDKKEEIKEYPEVAFWKKVIVAACDTFRAAAVEQLTIWAERLGVQIVKHKSGSDPAAVAYDACEAAIAREADFLILDTAGRLHTQKDLMRELTKIRDVVAKKIPQSPNEVLLVLDSTTGQNAIVQAKLFTQAIDVTGIMLAKLDGTARGGIVIAIKDQLDIPVKFVGLGEKPEDIAEFDPDIFVDALFN